MLLICACVLAGCDGGGSPSGTPASSPTIDFEAAARDVVRDALLRPEDVPDFTVADTADIQEQAELSAECDIFDPRVVFLEAAAFAGPDAYEGREDEQLLNSAGIYRTEEEASATVAGTRDLLERCRDEFEEVVDRVARDTLDDLGINVGPFTGIEITIIEYDPPAAGDEIAGYRMSVTVSLVVASQQYNLDVIVVREGRAAGMLTFGKFGTPSPATEEMLLEALTGRLQETDEALPE